MIREEEQQQESDAKKHRTEMEGKGKGKQTTRPKEKGKKEREEEEGEGERHWVRNPHGEERGQIDFARASTSRSRENERDARPKAASNGTEENEPEENGECLGCGGRQEAYTQCMHCGAPVEPNDGSGHYMYGWHEGSRKNCEDPRCREWVESETAEEDGKSERHDSQI